MTEHDPVNDDNVALADQMIGKEIDPASQSLAGALKTSFRLLSGIMVCLLVAYILSGFETIGSGQRGVVLRFGKVIGAPDQAEVLKEGVHFIWPFPVEEVLVISIQEQTINLDSFWHYERLGQAALVESEKQAVGDGLRPMYDGSLLTADQGLVHIKWVVTYHVGAGNRDVLDFVANVGDQIGAEQAVLRSVVENASVQAAAEHSADQIVRGSREFSAMAQRLAQGMLDELETGLRLTRLTLATHTPPLQTLAAFRAVTMAENERDQAVNAARTAATTILQGAAGENWPSLHKAIIAYERSLENDGDSTQRYQAIVDILHDPKTTGQARTTIVDARGDASDTLRRARIAYEEYRKLLESFQQTPELAVSRYWMDAQETIMANDMVVKTYIPPGVKTILWIKHDPEVWRTIRRKQVEYTRDRIDPYKP